jgi:phage terminase large subunit
MDVWFPRKLAFLREPHRYKILYGGRAGIKSWSIVYAGSKRRLRIPCAREPRSASSPIFSAMLFLRRIYFLA